MGSRPIILAAAPVVDLSTDEPDLGPIHSSATRTDQVVEVLREAVAHGTLDPSELYSVQQLAQRLGVSRTPVREALLQLAREGIVRFERNRGVRIVRLSAEDVREIFEIRRFLEVPATRKAVRISGPELAQVMQREYDAMVSSAKRGDERQLWTHDRAFHMALLCASGNIRLANYLDSLRHAVLRRGVTTAGRSRSLPDIAAAHLPVLSAALAGDEAMAARAMQLHIVRTSQLLTLNFADFEQHH